MNFRRSTTSLNLPGAAHPTRYPGASHLANEPQCKTSPSRSKAFAGRGRMRGCPNPGGSNVIVLAGHGAPTTTHVGDYNAIHVDALCERKQLVQADEGRAGTGGGGLHWVHRSA